MSDRETIKDPVEGRQGETSGHMRWVLGISVPLAIIVLGAALLWSMYGR